ncbi:amino-acid transporter subunit; membrane component of ABC superfamily [Mesorhizobium plurifarium]|uniref:Amino-acid transporter subunit membrane component of ABC superfamily n=1 Tax=Mesorhizobium plurifarium TaxID=69974 RepID=A0A0K2VQG6_MESPL|nr:amino-acid transporter subunit; membrane component of ABC superfamily [Mesorhizobium plurifarium]
MSISEALVALPARRRASLEALKTGLFGTPLNSALTVITTAFLLWVVPPFLRWAVLDATWTGTAADCSSRSGACWAFVSAKFRFILFAFYPPELQWRPLLAMVLIIALLAATALPRFWRRELLIAWLLVIGSIWTLMSGTLFPPIVPSNQWGGLPITLLVWALCFAGAAPLAVLLALARRSKLGGLRTLAVVFIELMRGTPMVAILYVAMLIIPMAVPGGQLIDKTVRAIVMVTLFWSAYLAEVVRAGLQAIPPGQSEAAASLGFGYWRTMQLVVLPQALRLVIPGMVNLAIGFLLATSLLAVIGIFDLLNAAKSSASDPQWLGFYNEAYLLAALIYFVLCFGGSRYSLWLERYLRGASTP